MEYNLYDLFEKISVRTGMYMGDVTLATVVSYIEGYRFAMDSLGAIDISQPYFQGFHDWVAVKYGFSGSIMGWANMILAVELGLNPKKIKWEGYSENATELQHKNSVSVFFKLVAEYKNSQQGDICHKR